MKKILALLFLCGTAHAGTITTAFSPLGTITFSSGTAAPSSIPVVVDSQTVSPSGTGGSSPMTWNMTIGSGSNRFLAVACVADFGIISGVTVNGSAMTRSAAESNCGADPRETSFYTSINPPSGSQAIVATWSGSSNHGMFCIAKSYTGVNQSSPIDISTGSFNTPGSSTNTVTWTTTVNNDLLMDAASGADATGATVIVAGSGQTAYGNFGDSAAGYVGAISTKASTTAGSQTMQWTNITSGCQSAIAIAPANP